MEVAGFSPIGYMMTIEQKRKRLPPVKDELASGKKTDGNRASVCECAEATKAPLTQCRLRVSVVVIDLIQSLLKPVVDRRSACPRRPTAYKAHIASKWLSSVCWMALNRVIFSEYRVCGLCPIMTY